MAKTCWMAKQYSKGWRLGFCVGNDKPKWLAVWFGNEKSINLALKNNVVFVEMCNKLGRPKR